MFIFHPALEEGYLNSMAKQGLKFAEWMIFVFSILFVLYSVNAFLKTRKKEFGILAIQGISPFQLRWLITIENMIIGFLSITAGIIGGFIFSKAFFTAGAYILEMGSLPLYLPWKALGLTFASFLILFFILSQVTIFFINSETVVKLLKGSQKPKREPKPSVLLSIAGVGFLAAGYGIAMSGDINNLSLIFILLSTIIGTYFFFSQSSIWILKALKKYKAFYLRGKNVIWISDLVYRLKDNARLFFIVSIISAVAFTATGVLTVFKSSMEAADSVYEMEYASYSENSEEQEHIQLIEQQLEAENFSFSREETEVVFIRYHKDDLIPPVYLMNEADFHERFGNEESGDLKDGEGLYYLSSFDVDQVNEIPEKINWVDTDDELHVKEARSPVITSNSIVVVNDKTYDNLKDAGEPLTLYGFQFDNWEGSLEISEFLSKELYGDYSNIGFDFRAKATTHFMTVQLPSLSLFIGLFIAIVFFTAAGSFLYFRLFTDLNEDQKRYQSLAKVGFSEKEMSQSSSIQLAILFFLPFALAVVHTVFALQILQRQGFYNVLEPSLITITGFLVLQILFFIVVRFSYLKKIKESLKID